MISFYLLQKAKWKAVTRNSIWTSHVGGKIKYLRCIYHLLPLRVCVSEQLELGAEPRLEPSTLGVGIPSGILITTPNTQFKSLPSAKYKEASTDEMMTFEDHYKITCRGNSTELEA